MKVKIGDQIHDAEKEPILLILTEKDKQNISRMSVQATRFCAFPEGMDAKAIHDFIGVVSHDEIGGQDGKDF